MPAAKKRKRNDGSAYTSKGGWNYPYGKYASKYRAEAISRSGPRGTGGSQAYWGKKYKGATAAQKRRRELMRFSGDGDYRSAVKYGLRGVGGLVGGGLGLRSGGYSGALSGAQSGWDAGAQLSKWAGFGDYEPVVANDIMMPQSQKKIAVNSGGGGDIMFAHTEFVQNVTVTANAAGSTPFSIQSFALNPGMEGTFPFLSQLASNFTLYEMGSMIFQYKPTSGEMGSTGANTLGKVILCTDYDPDCFPFTNSQAMSNYEWASSAKPSVGILHGVECNPTQRFSNQLYVRTGQTIPGPADSGKDKVQTDMGLFQVATEGISVGSPGTYVIGELWVTYTVKLSRASLRSTQAASLTNMDSFSILPGAVGSGYDVIKSVESVDGPPAQAQMVAGRLYVSKANTLGVQLLFDGPAATGYGNGQSLKFTWPSNVIHGLYRITIQGQYATNDLLGGTTEWMDVIEESQNCTVGTLFDNDYRGAVGGAFTGPITAVGQVEMAGWKGSGTGAYGIWTIDVAVLAADAAQASLTIATRSGGQMIAGPSSTPLLISIAELPYAQRDASLPSIN